MGDRAYDERNGFAIHCDEVATDGLYLHVDGRVGEPGKRPWISMNTAYAATRITVCPTLAEMRRFHKALGEALDQCGG